MSARAWRGVVVQPVEQRQVPALRPRASSSGQGDPGARSDGEQRGERRPTPAPPPAARRRRCSCAAGSPPAASAASSRSALAGADAGDELQRAQPARWPCGLAAKRSTASTSLTCAASRNLQAAVLDERNVAPRQLELERVAVLGAAKEHRLALQRQPRLAQREHALGDPGRLGRLVVDPDERRPLARAARSLQSCLAWRSAASAMTAFDAASSGAVER